LVQSKVNKGYTLTYRPEGYDKRLVQESKLKNKEGRGKVRKCGQQREREA
jgi:hypothetical protein